MTNLKAIAQMSKKHSKQSLMLIPYFFTFANVFLGFLSVTYAFQGKFNLAAYCIVGAALMDCFDGRIARFMGSVSGLGAELDSLCDAISFCFAPTILLYSFYNFNISSFGMCILAFYLCTGLFRLAKFNIIDSFDTHFLGLPTTLAAFFLASLIIYYEWITHFFTFLSISQLVFYIVLVLSLLMITPIPFSSFKEYTIRFPQSYLQLMGLVGVIFVCFSYNYPMLLFLLSGYIMSSIMWWLFIIAKHSIIAKF